MTQNIAITGATGFAGRHTVAELLKRGHTVVALARNPAKAALPAGVTVIGGDLSSADKLAQLVAKADAVVHLAGLTSALSEAEYFSVNEDGARAIAMAAATAGVKRFIHISSLAAREPHISPYAQSKLAGEAAILAFKGWFDLLVLRPPALYGPGDRATLPLLKTLTAPKAYIPSHKAARFSLLHVEDLARIIADQIAATTTGTRELSDGKPGGYGWDELAALSGAGRVIYLPEAVPRIAASLAESWAKLTRKPGMINHSKISELYHADWVAREPSLVPPSAVTLPNGLPATLEWYRAAGWLPRTKAATR